MSMDTKSSAFLKKIMGFAFFSGRSFNHSKCKTEANLAASRIKLLRNKRVAQLSQMRRDFALLLQSKQDDTAMIRVEHLIREQNVMAANEIIDLFCELIVARLPIIAKQKECPVDLKEGISSLIFAAPRCSEIPELQRISDLFQKKYGKEFISAAKELRPESGVNRMLVERLSVRKPTGEVKLKVMKGIAEEYKIDWDMTKSEEELLKPSEELIVGPRSFVSASMMDVKSHVSHKDAQAEASVLGGKASEHFGNQSSIATNNSSTSSKLLNPTYATKVNTSTNLEKFSNSQSFHASSSFPQYDEDIVLDDKRIARNNTFAAREAHTDIVFDDSDGLDSDEENIKFNNGRQNKGPPNRPAPMAPHIKETESRRSSTNSNLAARVHPKLPDYDSLAARFESLKSNMK